MPVLVVVAAAFLEELRPAGERRFVGDGGWTVVDVAVQDAELDAERGRDGEQACARLVERSHRPLEDQRTERVQRLWRVQRLLEPEAPLLEGTAGLAEPDVGCVQLLPPLAAGCSGDLERAGEAPGGHRDRGEAASSHAASPPQEGRGGPLPSWRRRGYGCPAAPAASWANVRFMIACVYLRVCGLIEASTASHGRAVLGSREGVAEPERAGREPGRRERHDRRHARGSARVERRVRRAREAGWRPAEPEPCPSSRSRRRRRARSRPR